MERSDTISTFSGFYEELMQNTSLGEKFSSQDFRDVVLTPNAKINLFDEDVESYELWKNLDSDKNALVDDNVLVEEETFSMENVVTSNDVTVPGKKVVQVGESIYLVDESSNDISGNVMVINEDIDSKSTSSSPSIGVSIPSLSLQPWKGVYDFVAGVQTSSYANSKWSYSTSLKKLFLRPFDAVPVEVKVSSWIDGHINITPVYVSSQHNSQPVNRCHNHKMTDFDKNVPNPDHIVQVDNSDAIYRKDGLRYSVDIPLGNPAPGESGKLLYVKCGCWNTCNGGPNRKPFCLVFTLFNRFGDEVGRQILHLKVCACPVRDRGYSEHKFATKESPKKGSEKMKVTKRKMPPPAVPSSMAGRRIKAEPNEQNYEQIPVPSEIAEEVKKYINKVMAEKYAKENNIQLPFPEY